VKFFAHLTCLFCFSLLIAECAAAQNSPRIVHVFVALADNEHQGIVPVPKALGNGDDPDRNLYWGAAFGVKTFFKKSADWEQVRLTKNPNRYVLESAIFRHKSSGTTLLADAYRGSEIKQALTDFFSAAAGQEGQIRFDEPTDRTLSTNKKEVLLVYVGHDGLMDFAMEKSFSGNGGAKRQAIVLACASKQFFGAPLKPTGAEPLLWTTNLMAPEAYTLKAALDGWIAGESGDQIRQRAAEAYAQYQKISQGAASKLFATGW
jgi:hypothetical protein